MRVTMCATIAILLSKSNVCVSFKENETQIPSAHCCPAIATVGCKGEFNKRL